MGSIPTTCASSFCVREVASDAEREATYRLRYSVYIAEQGKPYPDADHASRRLTDSLDQRGIVLGAFADGRVVGTVRINFGSDPAFIAAFRRRLALDSFASLGFAQLSFASRLAVEPSRRRTAVFQRLVVAAYPVGAPPEICVALCTCRPALVPLFEHLGYETYGPRFNDEGGGAQVAMLLVTRDQQRLRSVSSPFLTLAERHPDDPHTRRWLESRFAAVG